MKVNDEIREYVKKVAYDFFATECEIDVSEISDTTNIIDDLDGDSLMFLELIELFKKKYDLDIELKTIGKYNAKHPVHTIGELIETQLLIIEHGNRITDFA